MTSAICDSDDAMYRSLPDKAQEIMYESEEPPLSFVTVCRGDQTPSKAKPKTQDAQGAPDRSPKPHLPETQTQTRHGDSVLMSYLGPDYPDVAAHARNFPYTSWSLRQGRLPRDRPLVNRKPAALPSSMDADEGLGGKKGIRSGGSRGGGATRVGVGLGGDMRELHVEEMVSTAQAPTPRELALSPHTQTFPTLPPPPAPTRFKNEFVSPRQFLGVQAITSIQPVRRLSEDHKQSPKPGHRVTLPPLQLLPSSVAGTLSDSRSSKMKTKTLPSIQYALGGYSPSEFPSTRLDGVPPLYPYSSCLESAMSADTPRVREVRRQFLPSHIPPSSFPQLVFPVSAKESPQNTFLTSQLSTTIWREPPSPPPHQPATGTPYRAPTSYDMSTMTTKNPATNYHTPTKQIAPTPGSSERGSFSSPEPINSAGATSSYKCTHPGCTALPFKTEYLLK